MTDKEAIQNFGDMVEASRKLNKPWIIALIVTNALWAAVTFSLIWFAYMAPIDMNQNQDMENSVQSQTYSQNAAQGD